MKLRYILVLLLCLTTFVGISASAQEKKLVKKWVNEDVEIDPMKNETLSGTHRNEGVEALANAKSINLLEDVLRGYKPRGARVGRAYTT